MLLRRDVLSRMLEMYRPQAGSEPRKAFQVHSFAASGSEYLAKAATLSSVSTEQRLQSPDSVLILSIVFQVRNMNIVDPLMPTNNLGRSVTRANKARIRKALAAGASALSAILDKVCPAQLPYTLHPNPRLTEQALHWCLQRRYSCPVHASVPTCCAVFISL